MYRMYKSEYMNRYTDIPWPTEVDSVLHIASVLKHTPVGLPGQRGNAYMYTRVCTCVLPTPYAC